MLSFKIFIFAVLLLATDVFAGRINYSAKYHVGSTIARTSKNAEIPDSKEQLVVDKMKEWSEGKYEAAKSRHNIVQVTNVQVAASKGKASEEVQEMESIVRKHIK